MNNFRPILTIATPLVVGLRFVPCAASVRNGLQPTVQVQEGGRVIGPRRQATAGLYDGRMGPRHRFNIFGRIVDVERVGDAWKTYQVGNDGKRGPGGFVVPHDIAGDELEQYLFDLFHEEARPGNGDVRRIGPG
jgi:hypothetical protein